MRGYNAPPWPSGYGRRSGPDTVAPQDLRVSDAERQEIADALAAHYADGRLDRTEFDERMNQAMAAKTRRDLEALLVDLPATHAPAVAPAEPHRRRSRSDLLVLTAFMFFALASSWSWRSWAWHGWIWRPHLGVLAFLAIVVWLVRRAGHRRRGYRDWADARTL